MADESFFDESFFDYKPRKTIKKEYEDALIISEPLYEHELYIDDDILFDLNLIKSEDLKNEKENYDNWVENFLRVEHSVGLGDTIAKITKVTGVKKLVDLIFDGECGCEERQAKLNKMFPYKVEFLNRNEYDYLKKFNFNTNILLGNDKVELLKIYNRVFNKREKMTSCAICWKEKINQLKTLYDEHNL